MPKLPVLSYLDVIKALNKTYNIDNQTGYYPEQDKEPYRRLTIPNHREIAKGTLKSILRQAGLTKEEFLQLL